MKLLFFILPCVLGLMAQVPAPYPLNLKIQEAVVATETEFAKTMADRDVAKFSEYIAEDAIFFSSNSILRGKKSIVADWKPLFTDKIAPFSWKPDKVEVLASGNLALSTGPVFDQTGKLIATFTSIWRLDKDNRWRIIFDKGSPALIK